jgi:hypothetical protein
MFSKWFKRNNPKLDILADFGLRLDCYVYVINTEFRMRF